jgi:hypothetical protein
VSVPVDFGLWIAGSKSRLFRKHEPAQRQVGLSLARNNEAPEALFQSDRQATEAINSFSDSVAELNISFQLRQ